jgi:hypothetical protein
MDWTQTLTIILSIVGSMIAVWYAFYHMAKEDIKRHDEELREIRGRNERTDALWAELLKEIHGIKLSIATREK